MYQFSQRIVLIELREIYDIDNKIVKSGQELSEDDFVFARLGGDTLTVDHVYFFIPISQIADK
jgi:hypothetical protein